MFLILDEHTTRLFKTFLWSALITHAVFLVYIPWSAGGPQLLLTSNIRLVSFLVIFLAGLSTVGLIRKTDRDPSLQSRMAARLNTIASFRFSIWLLGLAIIAGLEFLLLPAFEAYQLLMIIPRIYPLIAPFTCWFVVQAVLIFIVIMVMYTGIYDKNSPMIRALTKSLLVSCGVLVGSIYLTSIFIAWIARRGFRLF